MWQGRMVVIAPDRATGRYTFDLGEGRSAETWANAMEAKTAAAVAILAVPRRDKERAAEKLLEEESRKDEQE